MNFFNRYTSHIVRFQNQVTKIVHRGMNELQKPKTQAALGGGFIVVSVGCNYMFRFNDEIEVKNKYVKIEGPRSLYMITSTKGKIYKFDKAIWKLHWSQAELWNSVEKGKSYKVKGFGLRWPFFGMYPNIHTVTSVERT